uniref:ATP-dependent (S)-NAD(P)H-hydrate dehydratase n=1 Tax=Mayetiola destructor TaxID=39758 RepID=D1MLM7_MAYDE|nr:putative carbohydrate kinase [Mayetiola destructor]
MSTISADNDYLNRIRHCVPVLNNDLYKGQAGRIGVVGGSFEYTGAPYFAGISALKVGADLVHVFCTEAAAIPIKSYSPELMVHPVLDNPIDPINLIEPWLERLHVIIIGPGLGRQPETFATVEKLIGHCRRLNKPLVLDADALYLLSQNIDIIKNYPGAILTPNAVEFVRIFGTDKTMSDKLLNEIGADVTILQKGTDDIIYSGSNKLNTMVSVSGGSGRRCGGQGDILSGCTALFYWWTLRAKESEAAKIASYGASFFVKHLNSETFKLLGRSMTANDMIQNIHTVFDEHLEHK